MEELNKLATQFGLSSDASEQGQTGLPLLLEYYSSTQVKLTCTAALPVVVVFPDLTTIEITATGILGTVTGSVNITYYIYLDKDGLCSASTTAPDVTYPNKKTLGDTKILVGWIAFSATNTIAGNWNVYSYWNQSTNQWTSGTINSDNYAFSKPGLVIPPGKTATLSRSGSTTGTLYASGPGCSAAMTLGSASCTTVSTWPYAPGFPDYCYGAGGSTYPGAPITSNSASFSTSLSPGATLTPGVYNAVYLISTGSVSGASYIGYTTYNEIYGTYNCSCYAANNYYYAMSHSGNLTVTRTGNV